jgi:putative acetyltransferase
MKSRQVQKGDQLRNVAMISREEAIAIASARLDASGWDLVVTHVTERESSWVVAYQPRKYLETNNIRHVIYGSGPMVISKATGKVVVTDSVPPADRQILKAERSLGIEGDTYFLMRVANIDPSVEIARSLLRDAVVEVRALYDQHSAEAFSLPENSALGPRDLYVAAFLDGTAIGCGALREFDRSTIEVRRMYVRPEHRRRHVAQAILGHLIAEARDLGFRRVILETGNKQAAAISLYENFGFRAIEPFGEHVNDPTSLCYELAIDGERHPPARMKINWGARGEGR